MRLAAIGPIWIGVLRIGLFRTRQTAQRRLEKLERSGRLRYAGRVSIDGGTKRSHVWCNRRIGDRMLRHETDVSQAFYVYWPHAYALTGPDVDPRYRADMELTIGPIDAGRTYMVEIDEDSEPLAQVRSRLALYVDCPRTVLFVAPSVSRVREVLRLTDNPRIYATTLDRCLGDPWGNHWVNCRGEAGHVAKPAANPAAFPAANHGR